MTEFESNLLLLRGKMEGEIASSQPYEAMLYCQSFLARKKKSLSSDEVTTCLVEGAKLLIEKNEYAYAATLVVWFIDSKLLRIDKVEDIFGLLPLVPITHAIQFLDILFVPFSKYIESNVSTGGQHSLLMLYSFCAPLFESAAHHRQAIKCYHSSNDIIGVARVLDVMAKQGHSSEYALFFSRTYLQLLSSVDYGILSDAFFVEAQNEYMGQFIEAHPEDEACQCWKLCDMIHDLYGLEDKKSSSTKIDKAGIFLLLLNHYSPLLQHLDTHILNLLEIVGIQVFKVQRQKKVQNNPLHAMMSNMFAQK